MLSTQVEIRLWMCQDIMSRHFLFGGFVQPLWWSIGTWLANFYCLDIVSDQIEFDVNYQGIKGPKPDRSRIGSWSEISDWRVFFFLDRQVRIEPNKILVNPVHFSVHFSGIKLFLLHADILLMSRSKYYNITSFGFFLDWKCLGNGGGAFRNISFWLELSTLPFGEPVFGGKTPTFVGVASLP